MRSMSEKRVAKKIQVKHITDELVCRHVKAAWDAHRSTGVGVTRFPGFTIPEETGCSEKVALLAMERASNRGFTEYGSSLTSAWLTEKGLVLLEKAELDKICNVGSANKNKGARL